MLGWKTEPRNSQKVVNIGEQIAQPANIVIVYAKPFVRLNRSIQIERIDRFPSAVNCDRANTLVNRKYCPTGRARDERAEQSGQSCCLVKCSISMDPMIPTRLNKLNVVMQMLRYTSSQTI